MRLSSVLVLCVAFATASPAFAENRVFIVANQPDEYGIDHCLANGERCGALAARSYCELHEFSQASSYRRVDPDEVTASVPALAGSNASKDAYVAITCQR
jgi:hypothetical protein